MKYTFCPVCGSPLSVREVPDGSVPVCTNASCGFIFWQNAKPCVVVLITNNQGRVLMTVRGREPEKGKLSLPGGFLNENEHPEDGAHREVKEELGVTVALTGILGFMIDQYGKDGPYLFLVGMSADIISGDPHPADDVADIQWVDPTTVDRTKIAFPSTAKFLDLVHQKKHAASF